MTFRLTDPDFWQHLLVGRAIWTLHRVPFEHLWTWPMFGQPDVLPSWGYRVLLWPFWAAGGIGGVFVLRAVLALAAFGMCWRTARDLGARGAGALVVIVGCALSYRARSQLRPEMLVALLLAAELWLLERRRMRGAGGSLALVAIAWAWANVHLSYPLGIALLGIHAIAAPRAFGATGPARATAFAEAVRARAPMLTILASAIAISFMNPFGWRALWQPFEYAFVWRHEAIYASIAELAPFATMWRGRIATGLPLLLAAWPLLVLWRPRGRRFDPVEALTCALFSALTLFAVRFASLYAIVAAPYLARDLAGWLGAWRVSERLRAPAPRAALASALCLLVCIPAWRSSDTRFGVGVEWTNYPVAACDLIERAGIRGRLFNPYYFGGYLLWRFWPERDRLPFMDIHQSGSARDRELAGYALGEPRAWTTLDSLHHFDVALIDGHLDWIRNYRLPGALDADSAWSLVFRDDAAELFVRRDGTLARVADSLGYRIVPASADEWLRRMPRLAHEREARAAAIVELERMSRESSERSWAEAQLATLSFMDGDRRATRAHLDAALAVNPGMSDLNRRLGYLDLAEGHPREAIAAFQRELRLSTAPLDLFTRLGQAHEALGEPSTAVRWYRRALAADANDATARAALERLETR